ncbi:unnamed protein product, partial [Phaeothamnion confervicola]
MRGLSRLTDDCLRTVARAAPALQELHLRGSRLLTPAGLQAVATLCPQMRALFLDACFGPGHGSRDGGDSSTGRGSPTGGDAPAAELVAALVRWPHLRELGLSRRPAELDGSEGGEPCGPPMFGDDPALGRLLR